MAEWFVCLWVGAGKTFEDFHDRFAEPFATGCVATGPPYTLWQHMLHAIVPCRRQWSEWTMRSMWNRNLLLDIHIGIYEIVFSEETYHSGTS
eukprot:scaffold918_cov390-Pavlova_lutheri.AAC.2